jgi:hypothetical protein
MHEIEFEFIGPDDAVARRVGIENLVIAGWTGRDREAVEKHIAELEALGVERPQTVPCFYRVSAGRLTTAASIQVLGTQSSGEVEFFLLALEDGLWVGVGSDHTDRKVEAYDVGVSKQMCAKPVGARLWRYADVADHWDQLTLRSAIGNGGVTEDYQEGAVDNMLPPHELMSLYGRGDRGLEPGTLMFCGTLAVKGGVRPAESFEGELLDPIRDRRLTVAYRTVALPTVA